MSSWVSLLSILAVVPQALASCAYGTHLHERAEVIQAPTFGYSAANGPANWFNLNPEANDLCATGNNQSPINLASGSFSLTSSSSLNIQIPDFAQGATFENLGSTVEVVADGLGGKMQIGNVAYNLSQFHFHLPSEHLDDGTSMAMEMHMVWRGADNSLAVIGIYIDIDDGSAVPRVQSSASAVVNRVLEVVDKIPNLGDHVTTKALKMTDIVALINSGSLQSYSGSLTTPPCSEGVKWYVSTKKVSVPVKTYIKARNVIGYNARFPQNVPGQENILTLFAEAT
ncbi:hypothetical protein F66182_3747 [Fusarium sp. NRRL 66182]|nr:hypothetical protein F66182_3747 [Fusarium sp. NRRL 66182]